MHDRGSVHGRTIALGGLELDPVSGIHRSLVKAVSQSPNHPIHVQLAVRSKTDFQKNFALKLQFAGFLRIDWLRLENDLDLARRSTTVILSVSTGVGCDLLGCKSCRLHALTICATIAMSRLGNAIAETGTSNCPLDSFGSASAIAGSRAFRQIKRSQ